MFFQKYIQSTEGDVPNMGFLILYGGLYMSALLIEIHASSPAIKYSSMGKCIAAQNNRYIQQDCSS